MNWSTHGFLVHHQIPQLAQTHLHRVSDAIQPSHPLPSTSPAFNLSQSGYFLVSQLFTWCDQNIGASSSTSGLPMNIQNWFPLDWLVWSPCSPRDSQDSSPTPQFKSMNSLVLSLLYSPTLTSIYDYWKNRSCHQSNVSAFNMLSVLVITFLAKSKCLLIPYLQSIFAVILKLKKIVCHCFHWLPIYLTHSDGTRCYYLSFLNAEFQACFFTSSFTFIKRLFSSSLLSAIRVVSSAYLRLLIFLLAILIPACTLSSPVFHMIYSSYKLNK